MSKSFFSEVIASRTTISSLTVGVSGRSFPSSTGELIRKSIQETEYERKGSHRARLSVLKGTSANFGSVNLSCLDIIGNVVNGFEYDPDAVLPIDECELTGLGPQIIIIMDEGQVEVAVLTAEPDDYFLWGDEDIDIRAHEVPGPMNIFEGIPLNVLHVRIDCPSHSSLGFDKDFSIGDPLFFKRPKDRPAFRELEGKRRARSLGGKHSSAGKNWK